MYFLICLPNFSKQPLTYLAGDLSPQFGQRVVVPYGKTSKTGIVLTSMTHSTLPKHKLRPIERILDPYPLLPSSHLLFLEKLAQYYHLSLNELVLSAIPKKGLQDSIPAACYLKASTVDKKQKILSECQSPVSIFQLYAKFRQPSIEKLINTGDLIESPPEVIHRHTTLSTLSEKQQAIYQLISEKPMTHLLWGATGSGKTEIYIHLIHDALEQQKQVLVLVPEIILTPQIQNRLETQLGCHVTLMHSGMSEKQRAYHWLSIRHQHASVILGTRSALLAPIPNLGLIIVDEEHADSYRQETALFFSARDGAILLGHLKKIPVILGSATPSLESYHNAQHGRYCLHHLSHQYAGEHAKIEWVIAEKETFLDQKIKLAVDQALSDKQHVMLYIGKRGYSRTLRCHHCGYTARCPSCDRFLVSHLDHKLHCHHCQTTTPMVTDCPSCQQAELSHYGAGSQRIAAIAQETWKKTPVIRVDTDNMTPLACSEALQSLTKSPPSIIVGTQMLTKGHDLKNLGLVVVIDSDHHFYSPDFRSEEKLFAELKQVAGRCGRHGQQGKVLIQTKLPHHPLYQHLNHASSIYPYLLSQREQHQLPPYYYLSCLFIVGRKQALQSILQLTLPSFANTTTTLLPWTPGNKHQQLCYQLMVLSPNRTDRQHAFSQITALIEKHAHNSLRLYYQVDSHLSFS